MSAAGVTSSVDGVQARIISSGQVLVPPSDTRVSVGVVGATVSLVGAIVALTVPVGADVLPPVSTACTAKVWAPGSSCRTQTPWVDGAGKVPGAWIETVSG